MPYITGILNVLTVVVCVFLICLILIQRGKGGGLAGAFGGVGGSSAFGTKSGDVFTKVTIFVAIAWIVLSMFLVVLYNQKSESAFDDGTATPITLPKKKATDDKSKDLDAGKDKGEIPLIIEPDAGKTSPTVVPSPEVIPPPPTTDAPKTETAKPK